MAVLKVYGSSISTSAMRVLACLYEKGLDFEFVTVDMGSQEHKSESFLAKNPFGQVPVFEEDDLVLFESRAITQHVSHAYATTGTDLIFHSDHRKMSILAVWSEVESQKFDPEASKLVWELVYKPMFGMATDHPAVAELEGKLAKVLDVYEARLAHHKYISGDGYGLADVHHTPVVHYLMQSQTKKLFEERPHVAKWVAELLGRPSWEKVLALQGK